jgi:hypothetical protein
MELKLEQLASIVELLVDQILRITLACSSEVLDRSFPVVA